MSGDCAVRGAATPRRTQRTDTHRHPTTTNRFLSAVMHPSQLGSEPDSWLVDRTLGAQVRRHTCNEDHLRNHATNGRWSAPQQKAHWNGNTTVRGDGAVGQHPHRQTRNAQLLESSHRPERALQRARQVVAVQDTAHTVACHVHERRLSGLATSSGPQQQKRNTLVAAPRAVVVRRVDALTDMTTTYRSLSAVIHPSQLGSEPDSLLELKSLRAQD